MQLFFFVKFLKYFWGEIIENVEFNILKMKLQHYQNIQHF